VPHGEGSATLEETREQEPRGGVDPEAVPLFPDRGHTLALDSGGRDVAGSVLASLGQQSL
jgi:hypothetical protein